MGAGDWIILLMEGKFSELFSSILKFGCFIIIGFIGTVLLLASIS